MSAKRTTAPTIDGTPAAELLRRLELTVTRRLDGLLQGDHRGLTPGHGSEPGEIRSYQPGDDVRRIDWNVTARTGEPHVRDTVADDWTPETEAAWQQALDRVHALAGA